MERVLVKSISELYDELEKGRGPDKAPRKKRGLGKKETVASYMKRWKANDSAVKQHNERVEWLKTHKHT
jgi:hypothetical protein